MDQPFALIVEDDRDVVALFRQVLDMAGYRTEIVLDGLEAMNRLISIQPDIVLLDLQLPGMSGVEILQKMRQNEKLATVPVVVVTANAQSAQELPTEPDLFLQKPVDIIQLGNLVQRLKATKGGFRGSAVDEVTGLYALPFFNVRLTFSLARSRQTSFSNFGVLFADILNFDKFIKTLDINEAAGFQRKLADSFKATLRPTDTMAWSADDGYFLTLIEEIPSEDVPLKIANRVDEALNSHLKENYPNTGLHANLGVLVCYTEYETPDDVKIEIDLARSLLKNGKYPSPAIFDWEKLHGL